MTETRTIDFDFLKENDGRPHDGAVMLKEARRLAERALSLGEKIITVENVGGAGHGITTVNGREVNLDAENRSAYFYRATIALSEDREEEDEDAGSDAE